MITTLLLAISIGQPRPQPRPAPRPIIIVRPVVVRPVGVNYNLIIAEQALKDKLTR